jgi:SAM-dependent methyltransferase
MPNPLRPKADEALAEWARRVRANREQVDRLREVPDGADFYGPVAARFAADPRRRDEPALEILRGLIRPEETWLDVGAGGGRYALPIALLAKEVIALDPSGGMLGVLRDGMAKHGIPNVRIVQARWPLAEPTVDGPAVDVALIAHVGYDVEEIGPFLDALEAAAPRRVAMLMEQPPASEVDALWPEVHGEARAALPALPEFLALQLARGRLGEVRLAPRVPAPELNLEQALAIARRLTWVRPGSEKDQRLERIVREKRFDANGQYIPAAKPSRVGIVTW